MTEDDRTPALPPLVLSLLRAEQRRPPPPRRQRRAVWRRTHRTLAGAGLVGPALLAGKSTLAAALGSKVVIGTIVGVLASAIAVGATLRLHPREVIPSVADSVHLGATQPRPTIGAAEPANTAAPKVASIASKGPPNPHGQGAGKNVDIAREAALIDQARAGLARNDVQAAMAATADHARRYPAGVFREEREALRVLCLARAGRSDATRAAAFFRSRYPRSVFGRIVSDAIKDRTNP